MRPLPEHRKAVSRETAAALYDVHPNEISAAIHSGALVAKKVNRRYRIDTDALEAWFEGLPDA